MHYPVMTERQLAFRWKISLKTLRRWRLDGEGPVWHKLFQHVRYHEADVLEFERQSAQHWTAILGEGERVPRAVTHPPKAEGDPQPSDATEPELQYISAKEIVKATGLPAHLFTDRIERERKRIPHLLLVWNLRFRWMPSCNGNWRTAFGVAYRKLWCKSSNQSLDRTPRVVCRAGMNS